MGIYYYYSVLMNRETDAVQAGQQPADSFRTMINKITDNPSIVLMLVYWFVIPKIKLMIWP